MADDDKISLITSLLRINVPWKNAASTLFALLGTGAVYFATRTTESFREVADRGNVALLIALAHIIH